MLKGTIQQNLWKAFRWKIRFGWRNKNRIENPRGFSEVGENKQLLIAIVSFSF